MLLLLSSHYKPSQSLFSQYLLLSQPLRTNPTLDLANFRGRYELIVFRDLQFAEEADGPVSTFVFALAL